MGQPEYLQILNPNRITHLYKYKDVCACIHYNDSKCYFHLKIKSHKRILNNYNDNKIKRLGHVKVFVEIMFTEHDERKFISNRLFNNYRNAEVNQ